MVWLTLTIYNHDSIFHANSVTKNGHQSKTIKVCQSQPITTLHKDPLSIKIRSTEDLIIFVHLHFTSNRLKEQTKSTMGFFGLFGSQTEPKKRALEEDKSAQSEPNEEPEEQIEPEEEKEEMVATKKDSEVEDEDFVPEDDESLLEDHDLDPSILGDSEPTASKTGKKGGSLKNDDDDQKMPATSEERQPGSRQSVRNRTLPTMKTPPNQSGTPKTAPYAKAAANDTDATTSSPIEVTTTNSDDMMSSVTVHTSITTSNEFALDVKRLHARNKSYNQEVMSESDASEALKALIFSLSEIQTAIQKGAPGYEPLIETGRNTIRCFSRYD